MIAAALAVGIAQACSSDSGSSHGPSYGELPPGSRDGGREGGRVLPDGAIVPEDEAGVPCESGRLAVLAGDDTTLSGAIQTRAGAWVASSISGAAKSTPALVAFNGDFLGVTRGAGDALQSTRFGASGEWSAPSSFGVAGVKGAPTLAVAAGKAHVVYSAGANASREFSHGIDDGGGFDAATAHVGSSAAEFSFGSVSAGLGAIGDTLAFVENGSNHGLYTRAWDGSWSGASPVGGAGTVGSDPPATPEVVAIAGGSFDAAIIYAEIDSHVLSFALRSSGATHAWSAPLDAAHRIDSQAMTAEKIAVARIAETTLLVAFRAQDGKGYFALGTVGTDTLTWSQATGVGGAAAPTVDSTPTVAPGVCGDDAVIAFAVSGQIQVTRLRAGSWTLAEPVPGVAGTRVAVASAP